MNRIIKFRAWDKMAECFLYPDSGFQNHYILTLNGSFWNLQNGSGGKEYEVMQFTGLQDKNGKDIYEGDIISYRGEREVKFGTFWNGENDFCGFFIKDPQVNHCNFGTSKIRAFNSSEVIGNIFEKK